MKLLRIEFKRLEDKACGSQPITSTRIPLASKTHIRVLRLRSTDWKSYVRQSAHLCLLSLMQRDANTSLESQKYFLTNTDLLSQ